MISAEGSGMGESHIAYSIGSRSLNNNPAGYLQQGNELFIGSNRTPKLLLLS